MEAGIDAGGDRLTPYSKFVDERKVPTGMKTHPASPSTVTNVASLPLTSSKRNIKMFLRERLFPPHHDIRAVLYKSLAKKISCNKSMFSAQMYTDFIAESYPVVSSYTDAPLPSFLSEGEDLPSYCLNDNGKLELRRILACINHHFPQISYCPILPPLIALFLHYDDSPSQVFMNTCHLILSNAKYTHYIDQNKSENEASAYVLRELIQRFAASSHKTLMNLSTNPDEIYFQWLKVLFYGLPYAYLVILLDMYLLDGQKALFRCAISVLKFYRKVGMSNPSDILSALFEFVKGIDTKVSTSLLYRKAYNLKLPSSKEIRKLYQKKMSMIRHQRTVEGDKEDAPQQRRNPWRYIAMVRNVESEIVNENLLSNLYCWIPERYSLLRPKMLFSTNKNGYSLDAFYRVSFENSPSLLLIKTTEDAVIGAFLTSDWSERKSEQKSYFGTGETFIFTLVPECTPYFWIGVKQPGREDKKENDESAEIRSNSNLSTATTAVSSTKGQAGKKNIKSITLPPIHQGSVSPSLQSPGRESRESSVVLPPLIGSPLSLDAPPSKSSSSITETVLGEAPLSEKAKNSTELFMYGDDNSIIIGGGNGYGLYIDSSFLHCMTERCDTFQNNPLVASKHFQCSIVELFGFTS